MLFDGAVASVAASLGRDGATHGNTAGIESSWNQLCKKGILNSNARRYFYKTAHNSDHKFVFNALAKSTVINTIGSVAVTLKNILKGVFQ